MTGPRWRCQVCGHVSGRMRQAPDEARRLRGIVFPARHAANGRDCPGAIVAAEAVWADSPPPGRPKGGPGWAKRKA